MPNDIKSFIKSYFSATLENTARHFSRFFRATALLKPKMGFVITHTDLSPYQIRPLTRRALRVDLSTRGEVKTLSCTELISIKSTGSSLRLWPIPRVGIDISGINDFGFAGAICRFKRNFLQQPFQNRMQTPRADIFRFLIHLLGNFRQSLNAFFGKSQIKPFRAE